MVLEGGVAQDCSAVSREARFRRQVWAGAAGSLLPWRSCPPTSPQRPFPPDPALTRPGHDCSLRLWSLDNKTCVQEITAHRKKHEEAIHAVACHPSKALIASAGADALAKVFV